MGVEHFHESREVLAAVVGFLLGLLGTIGFKIFDRWREIRTLRAALFDLLRSHSDCGSLAHELDKCRQSADKGRVYTFTVAVEGIFRKVCEQLLFVDRSHTASYSAFLAHLDLLEVAYKNREAALAAWLRVASAYPTYASEPPASEFKAEDLWKKTYVASCKQALATRIATCKSEVKLLDLLRNVDGKAVAIEAERRNADILAAEESLKRFAAPRTD